MPPSLTSEQPVIELVIAAGGAFLAAQFLPHELLWPFLVIYFLVAWVVLRAVRAHQMAASVASLNQLQAAHEHRFGRAADMRGTFMSFGVGFGDGYANAAANDGDFVGVLVGAAMSLGAKLVGDVVKSADERASEAEITGRAALLHAQHQRGGKVIFLVAVACGTFGALRSQGVLPITTAAPALPQHAEAAVAAAPPPSPPPPRQEQLVLAGRTSVRERPTSSAKKLEALKRGDTVSVVARSPDGKWVHVQTDVGTDGWIKR